MTDDRAATWDAKKTKSNLFRFQHSLKLEWSHSKRVAETKRIIISDTWNVPAVRSSSIVPTFTNHSHVLSTRCHSYRKQRIAMASDRLRATGVHQFLPRHARDSDGAKTRRLEVSDLEANTQSCKVLTVNTFIYLKYNIYIYVYILYIYIRSFLCITLAF